MHNFFGSDDPHPVGATIADLLEDFVDRTEAQAAQRPRRTIESRELGELVLAFLRTTDPVAYVRYASVYRSFTDVDEFMVELNRLRDEKTPPGPT